MRLKTLVLAVVMAASCMTFAQDNFDPSWTDSHSLINREVAARVAIDKGDLK